MNYDCFKLFHGLIRRHSCYGRRYRGNEMDGFHYRPWRSGALSQSKSNEHRVRWPHLLNDGELSYYYYACWYAWREDLTLFKGAIVNKLYRMNYIWKFPFWLRNRRTPRTLVDLLHSLFVYFFLSFYYLFAFFNLHYYSHDVDDVEIWMYIYYHV